MKIILFVDDIRDIPKSEYYTYQIARTLEKAKMLLNYIEYTDISLDYDIGNGETTLDLLKYIKDEGIMGIRRINIHTDNPKKYELTRFIKSNFPDVSITYNELK